MPFLKEPYPFLLTCPAAPRSVFQPALDALCVKKFHPQVHRHAGHESEPMFPGAERCFGFWRKTWAVQAGGTTRSRKGGEAREAMRVSARANAPESRSARPKNPLRPAARRHTRTFASSSAVSANKSPAQYPAAFLPRQPVGPPPYYVAACFQPLC